MPAFQKLHGFFIEHNVERALEAKENHYGFIGFYPVMLVAGSTHANPSPAGV